LVRVHANCRSHNTLRHVAGVFVFPLALFALALVPSLIIYIRILILWV
jgi:hypothetical protein